MKDKVTLIKGVGGFAVYINGYRVAGAKPWGGGPVLKEWDVDRASFDTALKVRAVVHAGDDGCSAAPDSGYRPVLHSDNCLIIVEQDDPQGYQPTTDLACTCGADPSRSPDRTSADRRQGTLVPNMRQRDTAEKQS